MPLERDLLKSYKGNKLKGKIQINLDPLTFMLKTLSKFFVPIRALLIPLVIIFMALGCSSLLSVPGDKYPPTDMDISELAPGSLYLPVIDYQFAYLGSNTHVRVTGTVYNGTGAPVQGARLMGTVYDQDGNPIAFGDSFIAPSYLAPEAKGTFEFVGLVKREKGVTHTRLVVSIRTSTY